MTICQATVCIGEYGEKHLCVNEASVRVYVGGELDRVLNVCSQCEVEYINNDAISIPKMTEPEMLKGVLGDGDGSLVIGFEDNHFTLYSCASTLTNSEIMCQHKNWEVFMVLCSEYSDYVEGEET